VTRPVRHKYVPNGPWRVPHPPRPCHFTAGRPRAAAEAGANAAAGRSRSAVRQFLRVSMYYWLASSAADGTGDPALFAALWEKHRAAWDRFIDLTELAAERIEIPYEIRTWTWR
jgi:hypothetical protein